MLARRDAEAQRTANYCGGLAVDLCLFRVLRRRGLRLIDAVEEVSADEEIGNRTERRIQQKYGHADAQDTIERWCVCVNGGVEEPVQAEGAAQKTDYNADLKEPRDDAKSR